MRKRKSKSKGSIFVISAPSGAGKTTICKKIAAADKTIRQSVSFTTRPPREGETDDEDYTFVSEREFREMAERGEFVEWAEVHGNLYGTSRRRLEELVDAGFDTLLDIDVQGALQIRNTFQDGVFVFILPPSMEVLRKRLGKRGSNTSADMEKRLARATDEIRDYVRYDYVIVNDVLRAAVKALGTVIAAERLRSAKVDADWVKEIFSV
jgi:guanylate kinase